MAQKPSILLVDSNATSIRFIKEVLGDRFELMISESAEAALFALSNRTVDLILLDTSLPRMDGIGFCRVIRNDDRYTDIGIIVQSARAMKEEINHAFQAGANRYIVKPYDHETLMDEIGCFLPESL